MTDIDTLDETSAEAPADPWRPPGTTVVAILALSWLALDLGFAFRTIDGARGELAAAQVALSLPSTAAATLVAGAAIGLIFMRRLSDRFGDIERWRSRALAGAVGGFFIGVLSGLGSFASYHGGASSAFVAGTLGVVGVIGGLLAAIRPTATVTAGLASTLAYAVVAFVEALFRGNLRNLFGNPATNGGYESAEARLALAVALVTGIIGGVTAFVFLRRTALALPWPVYLAAGAMPGLVLLFAEAATWLGARPMMNMLSKASELDRITITIAAQGLVNNGLIVFFCGAITAMILVGRTMRARA